MTIPTEGIAPVLDTRVDAPRLSPIVASVRTCVQEDLPALVQAIDDGRLYPTDFLRKLGVLGAYSTFAEQGISANLNPAIDAMSEVAEVCGATGFIFWCQNTLTWYVANSDNAALKNRFLASIASGSTLGGTGLSNPMKSFYGIEKLRLKGEKVDGGYRVNGALPWVSNLAPGHLFGTIFELTPDTKVMILAECGAQGITLMPCDPFLAMDGTGTYGVEFKNAFIPDEMVLAHDAMPFVRKIRAGFVLLQAGMAIGITRDCIEIMARTKPSLGHVNKFLAGQQPEDFASALARIAEDVRVMASTPYETSDAFWRQVVEIRLQAGDATMAAAHAAMLHTGARGYLKSHRAQRRMREAYFVGIVTPATKQLSKMLAEMPA